MFYRTQALELVREEFKTRSFEEVKLLWRASQACLYRWHNKNSKLLYQLARGLLGGQEIPEIGDAAGTIHNNPKDIASTFAQYYTTLYKPVPKPTIERDALLLHEISLPCLSTVLSRTLDEPTSREEFEPLTPASEFLQGRAELTSLSAVYQSTRPLTYQQLWILVEPFPGFILS
ncbi:hypothetical protein NDU88_000702 [Pleurodeles waltl]|uniref:Uncharacterized protein n=1 Tax=Pleurodeles waltl TaxID=8319 RepID=A0AAV7S7Q9_PLEWA|nr:hypothetical protein NDU88_000702 [Pleurodeles waltl]